MARVSSPILISNESELPTLVFMGLMVLWQAPNHVALFVVIKVAIVLSWIWTYALSTARWIPDPGNGSLIHESWVLGGWIRTRERLRLDAGASFREVVTEKQDGEGGFHRQHEIFLECWNGRRLIASRRTAGEAQAILEQLERFRQTIPGVFVLPVAQEPGEAPSGLELGTVTRTLGQARCPICGDAMRAAVRTCHHCETPHHRDCWAYTGGCSTYGCQPQA